MYIKLSISWSVHNIIYATTNQNCYLIMKHWKWELWGRNPGCYGTHQEEILLCFKGEHFLKHSITVQAWKVHVLKDSCDLHKLTACALYYSLNQHVSELRELTVFLVLNLNKSPLCLPSQHTFVVNTMLSVATDDGKWYEGLWHNTCVIVTLPGTEHHVLTSYLALAWASSSSSLGYAEG